MKYVPVMRFREEERKAFNNTALSDKIVPLVEIMTEKVRSNGKKSCIEAFYNDFNSINTSVFLDFPLYLKTSRNTHSPVFNFVSMLRSTLHARTKLFLDPLLLQMKNLIPVCTYDPTLPYISNMIVSEEQMLRSYYNKLAFRIFTQDLSSVINDILLCAKDGDIILYDIDEHLHNNLSIQQTYKAIQDIKAHIDVQIVLIRAAIPSDLTNVELAQDQIIKRADNSLLKEYYQLGFDAFGDYMGVKKDNVTKGGRISPGYIVYSWQDNAYYGFKGNFEDASTFETIIVPDLLKSQIWNQYSTQHKNSCYGCSTIIKISNKTKKGNSQKEWKGFAASHYLYTMEEFL